MNTNQTQASPNCRILKSYNTLRQDIANSDKTTPTQSMKIKILESLLKYHQCTAPK